MINQKTIFKIIKRRWFLNILLPIFCIIFSVILFYLFYKGQYFLFVGLFIPLVLLLILIIGILSRIKVNSFLKFLFWLTIISAITGPAFLTVPLGDYHVFPFRIFLPLILFLIVLQVLMNQGKLSISLKKIKFYLLFLVAWFSYAMITLTWAQSKIDALRQIFFLFTGLLLIFLIILYIKNLKDLKNFYWLWIILTVVLLGIGYWEVFTGNHLPSSAYLGRATEYAGKFRPSTVFYNTNDFATFLGLTFPFILSWLHYKRKLKNKLLGIGLLGGSFYLLLATSSRANLLALILETFVLFFFLLNLNKKIKVIISTILIFSFIFFAFPTFTQRAFNRIDAELTSFTSEYEMTVGSNIMRINLARNAIYYLFHSYGFGVGAGNIEWNIANFSPYYASTLLNLHNWWLEILANYGVFIFTGYLLFYFGLIYNLWKIWHQKLNIKEKTICETLLLSLIGFSIGSVSTSSIMAFKAQWIIFGFALAFLNYIRLKNKHLVNSEI